MKKRLIALLLCVVMLATTMGAGILGSSEKLEISVNGEVVDSVVVPQLGRVELNAEQNAEDAAYRWQFSSDGEAWIDVYGETAADCTLTYAKVKNMLNTEGSAQVRYIASADGEEVVSEAVNVTVEQTPVLTAAPAKAPAAPAALAAPAENAAKYTVTVKYAYENGSEAIEALSQSFDAGESVNWSIPYPTINGYNAKISNADGMTVSGEAETGSTISVDALNRDYTVTVIYSAKEVNYTVTYYYQQLTGDGYDEKTVTRQAKVGSSVPTAADMENGANGVDEGFAVQQYETADVEADGSTSVGIYCDRVYYLVKFDLDGGTGTDAIYAPFGAPLSIKNPVKTGYSFGGWTPTLPGTVPAGGGTYRANWSVANTKFVVAYYYQNADDDGYTYMGSAQQNGTTGNIANGANYQSGSFSGRDDNHFHYSHATSEPINGDGSTVVKVYFNRNVYSIKFYVCSKTHGNHGASDYNGSFGLFGMYSCQHDKLVDTISARYGQNIASRYAALVSSDQWYGHRWCKEGTSTCTALVTTMGDENTFYYLLKDGDYTYNICYMYESENGTVSHDGRKFEQKAAVKVAMAYINYTEDYAGGIMNGYEGYAQDSGLAATNSSGQNVKFDIKGNGTYYLYYKAKTYNIDFKSGGDTIATKSVKNGFSIKSANFTPDAKFAPTGYEFDGWYLDENLTEPVNWNAKMPAGGMVVYAKWKPITYTVNFLMDEGGAQYANRTASYGTVMSNVPSDPTRDGQSFVGWFYKDNGEEKAFDPANMQVKGNMTLYAKWSSSNMKQYFVFFVDENGNNVAAYKTGQAAVGKELTIAAKAGTQLYRDYQNGYFPTQDKVTFTVVDGKNEQFIRYEKRTVSYTVRYLEEGTGEVLHEPKVVTDYDKSIVTESFVPITDYQNYIPIEPFQQTVVLTTGENVITFWYKFDQTKAAYTISHYKLSENGNKELYGNSEMGYATKGSDLTAQLKSIDNYEFDLAASIEASTNGCSLSQSGNTVSATVLDGGVNIELIYKENTVTAKYEASVGGSVSVDSETIGVVTGTFGGSTATANAGYSFDGWYSDSDYKTKVGSNAAYKPSQVKNATYYAKFVENEATISYVVAGPEGCGTVDPASETVKSVTGTAQGSTAKESSNVYKFVGWYSDARFTQLVSEEKHFTPEKSGALWTDATYYAKFEYNLTSMTLEKKATPYDENDMFIFTVKKSDGTVFAKVALTAGEKVTLTGLTVGETYTVSEDNNWSWRYKDQAEKSIEMKPDASENVVTFENTVENDKWLGASSYAINKCLNTISNHISAFFAQLIN